jgi:hypothetical protein
MDEIINPALVARRRAAAEQLVRDQVLAETFRELPAPTVRQRLEASHYHLISSASPLAFAAIWRHSQITEADLQRGARHHVRFGS